MIRRLAVLGVAAATTIGACGRKDVARVVSKDEGTLCLGMRTVDAGPYAGPTADLEANQPIGVVVQGQCLSDECATDRARFCTAKRQGSRIVVSSELAWIAPKEIDKPCPGACSVLEASCTIEPLPPGHYTVALGARSVDVDVPSRVPWPCATGAASRPLLAATSAPPPPSAPSAPSSAVPSAVDPSVPAVPATGLATPARPPGDALCVTPFGKAGGLKAGQAASIRLTRPNPCVGSSCTTAKARCTAKRKGKTILVTSDFPAPTTKPRQPCTEDCPSLVATCKTDPLPAGTYTVTIGARTETLDVPSSRPPVCDP